MMTPEKVRRALLSLLSVLAVVSCTAIGDPERSSFIDAEAVSAACWARSSRERDSGDAAMAVRGRIKTLACFRGEYFRQYRAVIERYVELDARDGEELDQMRTRYLRGLRYREGKESCYPSCLPLEDVGDLVDEVGVAEMLVRDFVAERNLYRARPTDAPGGVFSSVKDADRLIQDCWAISAGMRSNLDAAWGIQRTTSCLAHVVRDQVEAFFPAGEPLSRQNAKEILDGFWLVTDGSFFAIRELHRGCSKPAPCGSDPLEIEDANLLAHLIRTAIAIRSQRGF